MTEKMVRLTFSLTEGERKQLALLALAQGQNCGQNVPVSELIRQAIALLLEKACKVESN